MVHRGTSVSGAVFSDCNRYRYRLWRRWDVNEPVACFVMLNPSTADESANDPTIERCERRARSWGCGGIEIANLFALRSTDPTGLQDVDDPVGPENDASIITAIRTAQDDGMAIMAWGGWGLYAQRQARVIDMLERNAILFAHAFKLNKDGTPAHPLYLPYALQPRLWWFANGRLDAAAA